MARPKGSHDFTPLVRGGLIRALKMLEAEGKPISEFIYKALIEDPIGTLQKLSAYAPKETKVSGSIEHGHTIKGISETVRFIEQVTAQGDDSPLPESGEDRPVLPH